MEENSENRDGYEMQEVHLQQMPVAFCRSDCSVAHPLVLLKGQAHWMAGLVA